MGTMAIPDHTGHREVRWSADDAPSIAEAADAFAELATRRLVPFAPHGAGRLPPGPGLRPDGRRDRLGPAPPGRLTATAVAITVDAVRTTFGDVEVLAAPPARARGGGGTPTTGRRPAVGAASAVLGATAVDLLEDLGPAGCLVRLADGTHAGAEVVVPAEHLERVAVRDERPPPSHRRRPDPAAESRAEGLLASVLRPSQRHQRAVAGTFWLHNRHGWFRLGALYDLRVRSVRRPWVERSICVVSEGYEHRPVADLWAELVVVLAADPTRVTAVANWNGEDRPRAPATDRAGLTRWLADVRVEFQRRRHEGDELHAAYLAYDVARRLELSDRPRWARPYAVRAAELVDAWAARWPDERDGLLDAHEPLLALPHDLGT